MTEHYGRELDRGHLLSSVPTRCFFVVGTNLVWGKRIRGGFIRLLQQVGTQEITKEERKEWGKQLYKFRCASSAFYLLVFRKSSYKLSDWKICWPQGLGDISLTLTPHPASMDLGSICLSWRGSTSLLGRIYIRAVCWVSPACVSICESLDSRLQVNKIC